MSTTTPPDSRQARLDAAANTPPIASAESEVREFALAQRDRATLQAANLLRRAAGGEPSPTLRSEVAEVVAGAAAWEHQASSILARQQRRTASISVVREPLTYDARSNPANSFFADQWRARMQDGRALERLARHAAEARVELRARAQQSQRSRGDDVDVRFERGSGWREERGDGSPGQGGYSMPPLWLVGLEGTAPRPERTLAALIPSLPLDPSVISVNVPRILAPGATAGVTGISTPVSDTDVTDAVASSQVITIAGHADVALQLIEQSGRNGAAFDEVVWRDLLASYDAQLEAQLVSGIGGSGPGAQLPGLLTVPGVATINYTAGSPTATGLFPFLGQAYGIVSDLRKVRPQGWLMRGGRYAWFATSEDTASRPLEIPSAAASLVADGSKPNPAGGLVGLPVFTDEALPSGLGVASNQDVVIAFRWDDMLLFEGVPNLATFSQALSGSLMGRVQLRRTVAAVLGRYPSGVAIIAGTGLVVPTNE